MPPASVATTVGTALFTVNVWLASLIGSPLVPVL